MILLSGSSNIPLAKSIAKILNTKAHEPCTRFADGEYSVQIPVNVRKQDVFIVQSTSCNVNDHILELLLMCDAAKRASAGSIAAVIPYFGYSRQDRKDRPRVPISSKLIADMLKVAGANRILTVDLHSDQQQGFFDGPWDNLFASYATLGAIKRLNLDNLVVVSPDKGGVRRAAVYARKLDADGVAIVYKERDTNVKNMSTALGIIGDVKGKNCLIVDDIIDTGGSIINAANMVLDCGALSVYVATTHGLFSNNATDKLLASKIKKVFVTDTVDIEDKHLNGKIELISLASLLSSAITRIQNGESISDVLLD